MYIFHYLFANISIQKREINKFLMRNGQVQTSPDPNRAFRIKIICLYTCKLTLSGKNRKIKKKMSILTKSSGYMHEELNKCFHKISLQMLFRIHNKYVHHLDPANPLKVNVYILHNICILEAGTRWGTDLLPVKCI